MVVQILAHATHSLFEIYNLMNHLHASEIGKCFKLISKENKKELKKELNEIPSSHISSTTSSLSDSTFPKNPEFEEMAPIDVLDENDAILEI